MESKVESVSIWLVVGATSGFGRAISIEALQQGHKVVAAARSIDALESLRQAGAYVMSLDVTSDDATIKSKAAEAYNVYGGITHLINCPGYILEGAVEESSTQEVYDLFNTNVFGILRVTREILPYMRMTAPSDSPRVVANFGSSGSWTGWPSSSVYCSTKWAISGLTEGLAAEIAPFGIQAIVIEPGTFRTSFLEPAQSGRRRVKIRLPAYSSITDAVSGFLDSAHGTQPGDVAKAGRVIVELLTQTRAARGGKELPLRLLLGTDCLNVVRQKCTSTNALIDQWEDVICSTDFSAP